MKSLGRDLEEKILILVFVSKKWVLVLVLRKSLGPGLGLEKKVLFTSLDLSDVCSVSYYELLQVYSHVLLMDFPGNLLQGKKSLMQGRRQPKSRGGTVHCKGGLVPTARESRRQRRRGGEVWGGGIPLPSGGGVWGWGTAPRNFFTFFIRNNAFWCIL